NSGPNGIAETRAEGADLVLQGATPLKLTIPKGKDNITRTVRLTVSNVEFGTSAPANRQYSFVVSDGTCPSGTVSSVDADASALNPGLQATANVPKGGRVTGSFVVTFHLGDVTSIGTIPFRCSVTAEADAVDTAPNPDDASDTEENNSTTLNIEVTDRNDFR
ncbi:MAG TPA: hypothetical protein VN812_14725, partial [Candidatus Acidoferrales bacterium]|nr:hypothetical protein [Candidatus Acidoferrales bacterium]